MRDKNIVPAVLYAAKSTEDKRGSIPDQLAKGRAFCEQEGWTVFGEDKDEGLSAYSGNRGKGLEKMKALALALADEYGECNFVALHSDRVARGAGDAPGAADHLVEVVANLRRHSVTLRTVEDDLYGDNRVGLLMAAVMGQRNTEDSKRKSLAVKAGMARSRKRGIYVGGKAFGLAWKRDENEERMAYFEPHAIPIIQRIYAEYLAGIAQLTIAQSLSRDGVPTARGGKWHQGTVQKILSAPVYAGLVNDGEKLIEGRHEGVIEREVWDRVQTLLASNRRSGGAGRPVAGMHIFRKGFLECECGGSMVPRTAARRTDGPEYEIYYCYERHRDPELCSMPPITRMHVDAAILAYFAQVGVDFEATREALRDARHRQSDEVSALLARAEGAAAEVEARLERVKLDYTNGDLTAAEWRELRGDLDRELGDAQAEAARFGATLTEVDAQASRADVEEEVVRHLANIRSAVTGEIQDAAGVASVRATLMRLFEKFVLHVGTPPAAHVELIGELWIEPILCDEAVAGFDADSQPLIRKEPLAAAANNSYEGFVT